MYSVVFDGFNTKREAEEFVAWYGNQGEQYSEDWFECRAAEGKINVSSMLIDYKHRPMWVDEDYRVQLKLIPYIQD